MTIDRNSIILASDFDSGTTTFIYSIYILKTETKIQIQNGPNFCGLLIISEVYTKKDCQILQKNQTLKIHKFSCCAFHIQHMWLKAIFGMHDHGNHQFTQKPIFCLGSQN